MLESTSKHHETKGRPAQKERPRAPVTRVGTEFPYKGEDLKKALGIEAGNARVFVSQFGPESAERGGQYAIYIKNEDGHSIMLNKTGDELQPHLELRRRLNTAKEKFLKYARQTAKTIASADERDVIPALEAAADSLIAQAATEQDFDKAMLEKIRAAADVQMEAYKGLTQMDRLIGRLVQNAKVSEAMRADLKDALEAAAEMYVSEGVHRILTGQSKQTPFAIASDLIREQVRAWEKTQREQDREAETVMLENRFRTMDADLLEGRMEILRLESELEDVQTDEARKNLLGQINTLDAAQLARAREWAHTYQQLHPDADAASIIAIGEERAGEGMLVGASFAGAKSKTEIVSRIEPMKDFIQQSEEVPSALERIVDQDATTAAVLANVGETEPTQLKNIMADVERPTSKEDIRSSREYVEIEANYRATPLEKRPEDYEKTKKYLENNRAELEKTMPAYTRALDLWLKDTTIPLPTEAAEKRAEFTPQEMAFFEHGDSGFSGQEQAASKILGIPLSEVRGLRTELSDLQSELKRQFETAREKLPGSEFSLSHIMRNLDFTWEQFLDAAKKPPSAIRRFFTALVRGERMKPAGPTIAELYDRIHEARNAAAEGKMTPQDWAKQAERTATARERIESRRPASLHLGPSMPTPSERPTRKKAAGEWKPESKMDIDRLPSLAESDAKHAMDELESQLPETKDPKRIRDLTKEIDKLEARDKDYRDAMTDFFERMDLRDHWLLETQDRSSVQHDTAAEYDFYMKSVQDYRKVFNAIMAEVKKSPGQESFAQDLRAAGFKTMSFDDVVIAASNKKKFDKIWKAYVRVAEQMGSGHVGRTAMSERQIPKTPKEA